MQQNRLREYDEGTGQGGGAYFAGVNNQIINATVAGNQAVGGKNATAPSYSYGGGLDLGRTATATLANVTVADNKAGLPPGGIGSTIGGGIYNGGDRHAV